MGDWFAARPAVRLDGTRLTLATAGTTIRLREVARPNRPLDGTWWRMTAFHDGDGLSDTQPVPEPELMFGPGKVERFGRLNRDADTCPGQAERALVDVLRDEVRYLAGQSLVLRHPSGTSLSGYEITVR